MLNAEDIWVSIFIISVKGRNEEPWRKGWRTCIHREASALASPPSVPAAILFIVTVLGGYCPEWSRSPCRVCAGSNEIPSGQVKTEKFYCLTSWPRFLKHVKRTVNEPELFFVALSLSLAGAFLGCKGTVHAQSATFIPVTASSFSHPPPFPLKVSFSFCKAAMWEE